MNKGQEKQTARVDGLANYGANGAGVAGLSTGADAKNKVHIYPDEGPWYEGNDAGAPDVGGVRKSADGKITKKEEEEIKKGGGTIVKNNPTDPVAKVAAPESSIESKKKMENGGMDIIENNGPKPEEAEHMPAKSKKEREMDIKDDKRGPVPI